MKRAQFQFVAVLAVMLGFLAARSQAYAFERETLKLRISPAKVIYDVNELKFITVFFINDKATGILLKPQGDLLSAKRLTVWVRQGDEIILSKTYPWVFKKEVLKPGEYVVGNFDLAQLALRPGVYQVNFWFDNQGVTAKSNFVEIKIEGSRAPQYLSVSAQALENAPHKFDKKPVSLSGKHYYSSAERVLDNFILLNVGKTAELLAPPEDYWEPKDRPRGYNVLVYGTFHYDESKRYGRLGQYRFCMDAGKIVFIDKIGEAAGVK